ncbi:transcriptional regulator [Halorubrum sp. JWXQ-INN 858]|uniref:helix-turn-helix domain-containing protein n=1 Tax=Halorubrum sp. JWXQ-INN 858 TaxID=2690782 RepID=UPI00135C6AC3|nr:helix-turn-helix domain-containing protein [Halorubrum sp. JWXQ-INN 858]MWV65368.1 transcriptional regulator [Halorubrum sp. JWXQ-INN 858]
MRELAFTLRYEPGTNAVADALADHPEVRIRSLSLHATPESLWRVDHAAGPADALDDVERAFRVGDYYADCLATAECGAARTTQVLEHAADTLVLYSYWERTPVCTSVPHIALDHLGDGALFETRHAEREYDWRVIHSGGGDVRAFLDAVEEAVGDRATLAVTRLTDVGPAARGGTDGLPAEQDAALRAAVEHGYYETPRRNDVSDLADRLGVPRSTLTYRLRRAEAHLAERYVAGDRIPGDVSTVP